MPSRDAAPEPTAAHRRRTPQGASRIAPLISDLACSIRSADTSLRGRLDLRGSSHPSIRTRDAHATELALAVAMVLPLAPDRSALCDELKAVPFAGEWIRVLLSERHPVGLARAVDALEQRIASLGTPKDPDAWCEQLLQAVDQQRRRSHGFYLTPQPLARFVVRTLDQLLQAWCGLPHGLAEECSWSCAVAKGAARRVPGGIDPDRPFVSVLDPAAGTGVFLIEALRCMHREKLRCWQGLSDRERDERWSAFAAALVTRLQGIEVMIGPYAVAHLQLRRALRQTGFRLPTDCILPIYLADALHKPAGHSARRHELEAWRTRSAGAVTVVLGNPPFSGVARPGGSWMEGLLASYKVTVRDQERQIQRLSNLYVRFLRLVQWMAERSGVLLAGLVTDRGWGEGVLYRDVRRSWLSQARAMHWIDLGGAEAGRESRGGRDESLFGIRQPTAVTVALLEGDEQSEPASIISRSIRGTSREKLAWMESRVSHPVEGCTEKPAAPQYRFVRSPLLDHYEQWPSLLDWAGTGEPTSDRDHRYGTGIKTRHDDFVIGMTPDEAVELVRRVAWRKEDDVSLYEQLALCTTVHFNLKRARSAAEQDRSVLEQLVRPLWFRPFDQRYVVYDRAFVCEPKVRLMGHLLDPGNLSLAVLRQDRTGRVAGYLASRGLVAKDMVSSRDDALIWPLYVHDGTGLVPNVSASMLEGLAERTGLSPCEQRDCAGISAWDVMGYIYAILWSPSYRSRHAHALCRDFPRIPLPVALEPFRAMAAAGSNLVRAHLDPKPAVLQGNATPGCAIDQVRWDAEAQRVWVNSDQWLSVPGSAWESFIGNHAVCREWLVARQGRRLSADELSWFGAVVRALEGTRTAGESIDAVIDLHGGWAGAFR